MSQRKRCMAKGVHEGRKWQCSNGPDAAHNLCWSHYRQYQRGKAKFTPLRKYRKSSMLGIQSMLERSLEDAR